MALMTSVTSSAPSRPFGARRSDIAVNPETSTKAIVPGRDRWRSSGALRSHSSVMRGRYGITAASAASARVSFSRTPTPSIVPLLTRKLKGLMLRHGPGGAGQAAGERA